jgi:hypothetical protein
VKEVKEGRKEGRNDIHKEEKAKHTEGIKNKDTKKEGNK